MQRINRYWQAHMRGLIEDAYLSSDDPRAGGFLALHWSGRASTAFAERPTFSSRASVVDRLDPQRPVIVYCWDDD